MASPNRIISRAKQHVSPRFLNVPISSQTPISPKSNQPKILNIDTPNRSKIVKKGLADQKFKIIGVGGFGTVYKASYKGINVAAKILKHNQFNDDIVSAEMRRANLRHKNIVRVIGCDQGETLSIIMLELCGPSLDRLIESRCLSKQERVLFLKDITEALKFCHNANIIHADVKPANIFIIHEKRAKLGDFGSSVVLNQNDVHTNILHGTAGYEAPEVIRGQMPTSASDIYSLGIVAWQMLSRVKPFAGLHCHTILYLTGKGCKPEEDNALDDEFNGNYKHLYRKMWSTNVEDRPDIGQVFYKLKELCS